MIAFPFMIFAAMCSWLVTGSDIETKGTRSVVKERRLKKKKDKKQNKAPSKKKKTKSPSPSAAPSPPTGAAIEECLVQAQLQSFEGPTTNQFCDGGPNNASPNVLNERANYQTDKNGLVYVNREDAAFPAATQLKCNVPFKFQDNGPVGDVRGAVCIKNTCTDSAGGCANNKGSIQHFPQFQSPVSISKLESFEFAFKINSCGSLSDPQSCLNQLYLNIYTEAVANSVCTFYDCRFLFLPQLAEVMPPKSTTVTDTWITYNIGLDTPIDSIIGRTSGGCSCPMALTNLNPNATLRKVRAEIAANPSVVDVNLGLSNVVNSAVPFGYDFYLNMGDSSAVDNGMEVCFDYFQYKLDGQEVVKFDFEPED